MRLSRVLNHSAVAADQAQTAAARALPGDNGLALRSLAPVMTAVIMAVMVVVSINLVRTADGIVVFWLPAAVASAAWMRMGRGGGHDLIFGGMIALGVFVGQLLAGHTLMPAAWLTIASMVEILTVVMIARRLDLDASFGSVASILKLLAGCGAAALAGAAVGATYFSTLSGAPFLISLQTWWFGHTLGMILTLPLLLSVSFTSWRALSKPARLAEWILMMVAVAGAAGWIYFHASIPMSFLLNALLVVVAARLRIAGVALAMLIVSACVFGAMLMGERMVGLSALTADARLIATQLMLVSVALPFLMVAALLHERDALAERARADQARAERASEAKSRLLANVAHEIKSPVSGIIGIGEMWSAGVLGPVSAEQGEMAQMLVSTARQVETLTHDLLDVAQAEAGRVALDMRPVDVAGVADDVRRKLALMPEASHMAVDLITEGDGLVARADSVRLTQAITNLATNAVKYGAAGGEVRLAVRRLDGRVRVEVRDRGPGLSREKQSQLFEPFNRLGLERSSIEGHGIGLTLAKRLTELMGGSIGVVSAPGEGATFWVELPAVT